MVELSQQSARVRCLARVVALNSVSKDWDGRAAASTLQCLARWMSGCLSSTLGPDRGSTVSSVACLGAAREEEDMVFDIHLRVRSFFTTQFS
jgi:hypothetical protein